MLVNTNFRVHVNSQCINCYQIQLIRYNINKCYIRGESYVWTDNEVELFLNVALEYKVSKIQENVDWNLASPSTPTFLLFSLSSTRLRHPQTFLITKRI